MGYYPGIPWPYIFISTWVDLPVLPVRGLLAQICVNPSCDIPLGVSVTILHKTSSLVYSHTYPYQGCCTSVSIS